MAPTARQAITVSTSTGNRLSYVGSLGLCAVLVYWVIFDAVGRKPAALAGWLAVASLVTVFLECRAWRIGVRFDDRGIALRNLLETRRVAWAEVDRFADAQVRVANGEDRWALDIVLRDGYRVHCLSLSPDDEVLDRLRLAAARFGIAAHLTGVRPLDHDPHAPLI